MAAKPARPTLTLAIQRFDRTAALHTRVVAVDDVMVLHILPNPCVIGLLNGTFDGAEMPLAHYAFLRDIGAPFTAIPVFPDRIFPHQYIFTRPDSGIRSLADLRGRRVITPIYYMTAALWHRGMLKDECGIRPADLQWHTTGPERDARMQIPADVPVRIVPGSRLGDQQLLDGTVDCLFTEATPRLPPEQQDRLVPVIEDMQAVQREWFRATGFHPIVHVIVLRQQTVDQRPEVIEELCDGFDRAKQSSYQVLQNERMTSLPFMRAHLDETTALCGDDPWPYGVDGRNGAELDQLLAYAHDQGLTQRRLQVEDLFDPPARRFRFRARMQRGAAASDLDGVLGLPRPDAFWDPSPTSASPA
jgi:4,5-dihydroxyphthalate decarboxylase